MKSSALILTARLMVAAGGILAAMNLPHAFAQTTSFTYQGSLTDGGNPANGLFDLQFRLFDAAISGNQVGTTAVRDNVPVTNGLFSVQLDFGVSTFPGANRFLEIAVRPGASAGAYTSLAPLTPITSAPYAIRSLVAGSADGLSPTVTVPVSAIPAGSTNYIRNGTTQQDGANFNISGNGTVGGTLRASDFQYNSAQTAYYAVSDAAFTARDGVPVTKATGLGGAYPTASTVYGLVAPVNLPHGATITNVRFIYIDNSTSSLSLILFAHSMTGGFYSTIATHNTTVQTSVVQNVNVAASWVVDNNATSFAVTAFPTGGWSSSAMQIRGVVITYTMPRPAR